jgi:hypothetical protein
MTAPEEQTKDTAEDKKQPESPQPCTAPKTRWIDYFNSGVSLLTLLTLAVYTYVVHKQLDEMRKANTSTDSNMRVLLDLAKTSASDSAANTAKALEVGARSARAAEDLAARERPLVAVADVTHISPTANRTLTAEAIFKNGGPLPALDVAVLGGTMTLPAGAIFPDRVSYGPPPGMSQAQWEKRASRSVVGPGESFKLLIPLGPYDEALTEAIKNGTTRLYINGCVTYRDQFRRFRTLKYCGFYEPRNSGWNFCAVYNAEEDGRTCH